MSLNFHDFLKHNRRFGWSVERAREHYAIAEGIRNRYPLRSTYGALNEAADLEEVPLEDVGAGAGDEAALLGDTVLGSVGAEAPVATIGATTVPIGGAVAGVGLGTVAVGSVVAGISNYFKRKGLTAPWHNNLGPGNDPNPDHYDKDDAIAYDHDVAYANALHKNDIFEADKVAIKEFAKDYEKTGNIHSKIAEIALSTKHKIETKLDRVIYPHVSNDPVPIFAGE